MTQVSLVDSVRLSALLQDALSWKSTISSILVSARNGSILAYAFRNDTPSIKAMRTRSTTITAAYTVAAENVLVFESQTSRALTVIAPIADHILLAVTGPEPVDRDPYDQDVHGTLHPVKSAKSHDPYRNGSTVEDDDGEEDSDEEGNNEQIRGDLEEVNRQLADILMEELSGLKWPDDI